jgi:hypothetical protein
MPHRHPEDRIYTVMSGVFDIGLGEAFDGVQAFPPGTVVILPGNTPHFHWAKSGEYVTQVTAIGPLGLEYVDPTDDPRLHHSPASLKCSVPTGTARHHGTKADNHWHRRHPAMRPAQGGQPIRCFGLG